MTFQDIFKSNFLDHVNSITMFDMVLTFFLAFAVGLLIFFIYKRTFSGVMYSSSFGISLIGLTLITTFVIMAISTNVVLSLGMVGSLSIVRFRTAVKEPMDIVFLFWSIAAGIVLAAGLLILAVFGSAFIAVVLLIFAEKNTMDRPYILVVHCSTEEEEQEVLFFVKKNVKKYSLKSKSIVPGNIELNYEIRIKDHSTGFINQLADLPGVSNVVMVSYNGDYMG